MIQVRTHDTQKHIRGNNKTIQTEKIAANRWIYIEIRKEMTGPTQAGKIVQNMIKNHLKNNRMPPMSLYAISVNSPDSTNQFCTGIRRFFEYNTPKNMHGT